MSARTPFIPMAKDPRATNTKEQTQSFNKATPNTVFSPDLSNPLHASANAQSALKAQSKPLENTNTSQSLASNGSGNPSNTNNALNPLNVGSLMKKTPKNPQAHGQPQNQSVSRRPSFAGNTTARPGTADPHSKALQNQQTHRQNHNQSTDIIAPTPRQAIRAPSPLLSTAQASGIFSSSSFKTPSLPQNAPTDKPNDAHTSTSTLGFSFAKPKATSEQQHASQLPSPPTSIRISSSRTFESQAVIDLDQEMPSFSLNTSLPNQTGPQRVLINPDGNRSSLNLTAEQESRRGNQLKRPRTDHESIDGNLATSDAKRYKNLAVSLIISKNLKLTRGCLGRLQRGVTKSVIANESVKSKPCLPLPISSEPQSQP